MLKYLSEDEQHNQLLDVFTEVKILTGALMFSGDELKIQIEVLRRFITAHPSAKNMTIAEIRHAFYLNNFGEYETILRHYNRELNAEFVGDVLNAYHKFKRQFMLRARDTIRALLYPKATANKLTLTNAELQLLVQKDYDDYKIGNTLFIFNVKLKYLFLRKIKLIQLSSKASWERNYWLAMKHRANEPLASATLNKNRKKVYESFLQTGYIPLSEHKQIVSQTRKIIYFKFFKLLADTAIHNIFEDIDY